MSQLHKDSLVLVIHDHEPIADDLHRCLEGGITGKVMLPVLDVRIQSDAFATGPITEGWARHALEEFGKTFRQIEATEGKAFVATSDRDFVRAKQEGRLAILLGAEGGKLIEESLELLQAFYCMGLRVLQLTWAFPNQISRCDEADGGPGLLPFGRELIRELNRLGVLVDVEHAGQKTFYQTLELSRKPIVMSHGGTHGALRRSRHPEWSRGDYGCFLDDDMLKALSQNGGLLGINFFGPAFYRGAEASCDITLDDVLDHFDYVAGLVGPDTLALGCDYFPTYGHWAELQRNQNSPPEHFVLPKEQLPRFTAALLHRGWNQEDITKVLGGNFLRVCREVFGE